MDVAVGALALEAAIFGWLNRKSIREVHLQMNSRLDQLLRASGAVERAEGVREGRAQVEKEEA